MCTHSVFGLIWSFLFLFYFCVFFMFKTDQINLSYYFCYSVYYYYFVLLFYLVSWTRLYMKTTFSTVGRSGTDGGVTTPTPSRKVRAAQLSLQIPESCERVCAEVQRLTWQKWAEILRGGGVTHLFHWKHTLQRWQWTKHTHTRTHSCC